MSKDPKKNIEKKVSIENNDCTYDCYTVDLNLHDILLKSNSSVI